MEHQTLILLPIPPKNKHGAFKTIESCDFMLDRSHIWKDDRAAFFADVLKRLIQKVGSL